MTDIEKKALALANEVRVARGLGAHTDVSWRSDATIGALCRAIEQHEAFRREVSDAVKACGISVCHPLHKFIIAKPVDPLFEAWWIEATGNAAEHIRAALAARGLKIVKVGE